jgi:hypothetical protein
MSIFKKSTFSLISEACKTEESDCDDLYDDSVLSDLDGEIEDIDDVEESELRYTEEMVTVIESADKSQYFIETDNLSKYMISQNIIDVSEAISNICNANSIEESKICLVIESEDDLHDIIKEARATSKGSTIKSKKLGMARDTTAFLKNIKNKGIKIAKKKSKKK